MKTLLDPDLQIDYTTQSSEDLLHYFESTVPDVLLMDMQMPGLSGVELGKMILRQYPQIKIIAFSSFDDSSLGE